MKKFLLGCLLASSLAHLPASAGYGSDSPAFLSAVSVVGTSYVVLSGPVLAVKASADTVVASVEKVGDVTVVVLEHSADGSRTTLRLSGKAAGNLSLGVGKAVTVTATASGHVLSAAGEIIAFLPNALGESLLHHSRSGS